MPDDWIRQQYEENKARDAGVSVVATRNSNPQQAGRANALSRQTGVPADVVERNLAEVEAREQAINRARAARNAPTYTRDWLANPRNAAAAGDDFETLSRMTSTLEIFANDKAREHYERLSRRQRVSSYGVSVSLPRGPLPSVGSYAGGVWERFKGGLRETGAAVGDMLSQPHRSIPYVLLAGADLASRAATGRMPDPTTQRVLERIAPIPSRQTIETYRDVEGGYQSSDPEFETGLARGVYGGVSSFAQQVPGLALSVLTRSPAPTLAMAGTMTAGQAYSRYAARGATGHEAMTGALGEGAVEVGTEFLPAAKLIGSFMPGKSFLRELGISILSDIPGEQIATMAQDALDTAIANPDATWSQYWADRPQAALDTLIATLTQGALTGGLASVGRVMVRRAETNASTVLLDDVMEHAAQTQMRETDPQGFHDYIQGLTQNTPVENIYIPAEAIRELMQDGYRDDPFWSKYADQIDEAGALEGDVVIPLADAATHLAGTPEWNKLREEARFSPGGLSAAEMATLEETYRAGLEGQQERLVKAADQAQREAEPAAQVYEDIHRQLIEAGYTPSAADKVATVYAAQRETWGQRLGMTAMEYHQQNPVQIKRVGEAEPTGRVIQQDEGATAIEQGWETIQRGDDAMFEGENGEHVTIRRTGRDEYEIDQGVVVQRVDADELKRLADDLKLVATTETRADARKRDRDFGKMKFAAKQEADARAAELGADDKFVSGYMHALTGRAMPESYQTNEGAAYRQGYEQAVADGKAGSLINRGPARQGADNVAELERAGDRGGRRTVGADEALEGAPQVEGATGPIPELVAVAEAYAAQAGIPLTRQASYVEIDEEFSKRVADAYENMPHAPNDPVVRAAYEDLIRQTRAQYNALVAAGYEFSFGDPDDPYFANPWTAMRDLRENKRMKVFPTGAGFGVDESFTPEENPLLAPTGIEWGGQPVLANDLFRAVHDAFGHGLEGAGFRARGEENAWQAHARLFTGPALAALTSETRGQNSWLNFGPYGAANQTASAEDTHYADQKTGLMPSWTWTERVAGAIAPNDGGYEQAALASELVEGEVAGVAADGRGIVGWSPSRIDDLLRTFGYAHEPARTKAFAVRLSPEQFLGLTASVQGRALIEERVAQMDEYDGGVIDFARMAAQQQSPMLIVKIEGGFTSQTTEGPVEVPVSLRVMGHEGRHRMTMLKNAGVESIPVVVQMWERGELPSSSTLRPQRSRSDQVGTGDTEAVFEGMEPISYANAQTLAEKFGHGRVLFQDMPLSLTLPPYAYGVEDWQQLEMFPGADLGMAPDEFTDEELDMGDIDVDGVLRPITNAEGEMIGPTPSVVRNFWRWFGDSEMVDPDGHPRVFYHGTRADFPSLKDTFAFEGSTFFFAADKDTPRNFAYISSYGEETVMPVYLKLTNLAEYDADNRTWDAVEEDEYERDEAADEARKRWKDDQIATFEPKSHVTQIGEEWVLYDNLNGGEVQRFDNEGEAMAELEEIERKEREAFEQQIDDEGDNMSFYDLVDEGYLEGDEGNVGTDAIASIHMGEKDAVYIANVDEGSGPTDVVIVLGDPHAVKHTGNYGSYDPADPRVLYQSENPPLYSALAMAAANVSANRAPAQQWIATLKKAPGVKEEELEWTGIIEWLEGQTGPVEKADVIDVIAGGGIYVEEVMLGGGSGMNQRSQYLYPEVERALTGASDYEDALEQLSNDGAAYRVLSRNHPELFFSDPENSDEGEYNEEWANDVLDSIYPGGFASQPKFQHWSSDKASDTYRELLLTLPPGVGNNPDRAPETHWMQPNVVAHVRFMDKAGPNGEKILFVEEVQSDWHQKGRDEGYNRDATKAEMDAASERWATAQVAAENAYRAALESAKASAAEAFDAWREKTHLDDDNYGNRLIRDKITKLEDIIANNANVGWLPLEVALRELTKLSERTDMPGIEIDGELVDAAHAAGLELNEASQAFNNMARPSGIPDAPFKKSWPELVMKRVIHYAATNGYDQVAWTTGEQQAERYNLSHHIENISISVDAGWDVGTAISTVAQPGRYVVKTGHGEAERALREQYETTYAPAGGIYMTEEQVRDAFGADLGGRMIERANNETGKGGPQRFAEFGGEDLRVGGEGMKAFYDRNLVNITNKIIKKYGAKVEEVPVVDQAAKQQRRTALIDKMRAVAGLSSYGIGSRQEAEERVAEYEEQAKRGEGDPTKARQWAVDLRAAFPIIDQIEALDAEYQGEPQPGFTITDELRAGANEGFALFQGGARGRVSGGLISGTPGPALIELFDGSDLSTVLHETGHVWLEELKANASREGAEGVAEDWQAVQDWFAANGIQMGPDGFIPTEGHELWARGFERYLMEGKAPSAGLRRAFDAFRSWLLTIYKHVANLNSPITPEIRRVFDRMLATQEEIDAAADGQQVQARFANAAQAGMTEAEFAAYRQVADEARTEAFDALLYRTMAAIRRERTKAWKDEEARVRDEVTGQINARPEFRALHFLRTGRFLDDPEREPNRMRLDKAWLEERGVDLDTLPKGVPPIYKDDGDDPEIIANMVGFKSADEMVAALQAVQQVSRDIKEAGDRRGPRQRMLDDEVERIMAERHGDPLNDGSIEEEALAAIHNEREGEVIASEHRALARQRREQPTPYSMAREWARKKIMAGRVVDVASRSAIQRYARAQAKAAKAFEAALAEGNIEEAFRQSEIRLLNHALIAEASKAAERVETAVDRLSRVAKQKTRKSVAQDYMDRAHMLLEKFEFRPRSQRNLDEIESFEAWAAKQEAMGVDVIVPPRLERDGEHYSRIAVEELLGLDESVNQLLHLGRRKKKLLDAKEQREFDEVIHAAVATVEGTHQPRKNNRITPSKLDRLRANVASFDAALLKMEQVFDWLDDGNPNGVFNRHVFRPIAEAQARERDMLGDYLGQVRDLLRAIPKEQVRKWNDKVETPLLNRETGEPFDLTHQDLIAMALNVGNEGNFQKLAGGYGWNRDTVMQVLNDNLSPEEWQFVQNVWDLVNTLWPEIEALEKRVNGVAPEKIEPREFALADGTQMRGGYYPVVYDPLKDYQTEELEGRATEQLFATGYQRATTRQGHAKERTKVERPIHLSLSVLNRHLTGVIHDITHREPIMQADRFLSDRRIKQAVDASVGREVRKQFRPWLSHIANEWAFDSRGLDGVEALAKRLRTSSTIVGMGFRLTTILSQAAGYAGVAEKIGTRWLASGVKAVSRDPVGSFAFVMERSGEVRHRMDTLERDIDQNVKEMAGKTGLLANVRRFAFHGIGYMDRAVVIPAWIGGYTKAMSEGMTEEEAAHYADKVIRESQGAGGAKDLSALQRANEYTKLATMFYSFASAFYNRQRNLARDVRKAAKDRDYGEFPGLLARAWWLMVVGPLLGQLPSAILGGGGPDEDKDETWAGWMAAQLTASLFYGVPIARDVASSLATGFDYQFTPASRAIETVVRAVGDMKSVLDMDDETEPSDKAVKTGIEAAGYTLKLPFGQLANATQFLVDWANGETDPDGVGDWLEGLQRGKLEE